MRTLQIDDVMQVALACRALTTPSAPAVMDHRPAWSW
jgi:hypothetical protein